ncbi:hypothetical protein CYMTET_44753, partial [Cymbomonas tetramitiformis]
MGTPLGIACKELMKNNVEVPDEISLQLLKNAMKSSGTSKVIIEDFPTSPEQAARFEKQVGRASLVINIECSTETMLTRSLNNAKMQDESDLKAGIGERAVPGGFITQQGSQPALRDAGVNLKQMREILNHRMEQYEKRIGPVKEYFLNQDVLLTVSGEGATELVMDTYTAAVEHTEELIALKAKFLEFDADSSGTIDMKELTECFSSMGKVLLPDDMRRMKDQYGMTPSGELHFPEFVKLCRNELAMLARMEEYRVNFKIVDRDGSGEIDMAELQALFRQEAPQTPPRQRHKRTHRLPIHRVTHRRTHPSRT